MSKTLAISHVDTLVEAEEILKADSHIIGEQTRIRRT
jgi:hypothetical protein